MVLIPIPLGSRVQSTASETFVKCERCEHCQAEYVFQVTCVASGRGYNALFMDGEGCRGAGGGRGDPQVESDAPDGNRPGPVPGVRLVSTVHDPSRPGPAQAMDEDMGPPLCSFRSSSLSPPRLSRCPGITPRSRRSSGSSRWLH